MKVTTVRMDEDILGRINGLARELKRSRSWVIKEAIERFLDYEEWYIQEVRKGIDEVSRGEIATSKEVKNRFQKYGVNVG
ncbi:MAG: ribbon-helix-helix protein, CopG family [Desulfobacteraceae bacterium]